MLVYNIDNTNDIFSRFVGIDGSAYLVGGLGVNFQSNEKLSLGPHPHRCRCPARRQHRLSEIHGQTNLESFLSSGLFQKKSAICLTTDGFFCSYSAMINQWLIGSKIAWDGANWIS